MRCLVLGGEGFLGSHLVRALAREGHAVRSFDQQRKAASLGKHVSNVEYLAGDFLSPEDLTQALQGVEVCFHLISTTIASTSNANPMLDVETNLLGTIQLLQCTKIANVRRIVFISSGGTVYGIPKSIPITEEHSTDPICSYGITKLAIEKYLHLYRILHGLSYVTLRLANPYGEGQRINAQQGAIAVFLGRALRGEEISIWGDGSVIRDYIYVDDAINAMIRAADEKVDAGCVLNIGSGVGYSINEILATIEDVTGCSTNRNYVSGRTYDVPVNVLDISAANVRMQWEPEISLKEGIQRFANWVANAPNGR